MTEATTAPSRFDLTGKVVVVTGAAQGLGGAMAKGAAWAGASLVLADIEIESLAKSGPASDFDPRTTLICQLDISDFASCRATVDLCLERFGRLDVLVNNAGRGPNYVSASPGTNSLKFWDCDPHRWADLIHTNVVGTYFMSHLCARPMLDQGWGRIINISTSLPTMYRREGSPYGVSKAAIDTETLIFARDLAGTGVTINTLAPGAAVDTAFVSPSTREAAQAGRTKLLQPSVMVEPMLWLASDLSSDVSGARLIASAWDAMLPLSACIAKAMEPPVLRTAQPLTEKA